MTEQIVRFFLPAYFVAYILVGGVWAVARMRRKYGVDPLAVVHRDPLVSLGESYRNLLFGTALALAFANALDPALMRWLGPIPSLLDPRIRLAGVAVLVVALVVVGVSQRGLKGSWRFGCDRGATPTGLITDGVYAWSRNPIYVGMILTGAGLFLALPNAVTLAAASLTVLLLQVRAQVEEAYLREVHGEPFLRYCRRTPRWLPGGGRIGSLFRRRAPPDDE